MQWSFDFDEAGRFVRTSLSGDFIPNRLIGFFSGMLNQSYWRPGTPLLLDLSSLNTRPTDRREAEILKSIMSAVKMRLGFGKLALVCANEDRFEFGRQFSSIAGPAIDREICVFLLEEAAISWLISFARENWPIEGVQKREALLKDETLSSVPVS